MKHINIYYGAKCNAILSNLHPRPFVDKDTNRPYYSVEHYYQTNKSGSFCSSTYQKDWSGYKKWSGVTPRMRNQSAVEEVMMTAILQSFQANPAHLSCLLRTEGYKITHNEDKSIWGTRFPAVLENARDILSHELSEEELTHAKSIEIKPLIINPF